MNWFHQLSSGELGAIVFVVTLLVSITGLAVTARKVRETKLHEALDNGAIAGLLAALIGIYAVAAGLTAVAVWGNTGDAAANGPHAAHLAAARRSRVADGRPAERPRGRGWPTPSSLGWQAGRRRCRDPGARGRDEKRLMRMPGRGLRWSTFGTPGDPRLSRVLHSRQGLPMP